MPPSGYGVATIEGRQSVEAGAEPNPFINTDNDPLRGQVDDPYRAVLSGWMDLVVGDRTTAISFKPIRHHGVTTKPRNGCFGSDSVDVSKLPIR